MTLPRARALIVAIALAITLPGCGDAGGDTASHAVVRDSAGIRIVESTGPVWSAGEGWRLADQPVLEIGMADGDAQYLLDRVTGAIRSADGGVVVANAGSAEIRYYDDRGTHLKSAGRRGDGPGEFQDLTWMHPYRGDSLMVYDQASRRISILSQDGEYGRSLELPAVGSGGRPFPMAPLDDGSIVARLTVVVGPGEVVTGMRRSDAMYGHFSASDGALLDSIARLPGEERYLVVEPSMLSVITPLLGAETHAAVHGDSVFLGYSDVHEVRSYALDGRLRTLVRRSTEPVPLTRGEVDRLMASRLDGQSDAEARQRMADVLAAMPVPGFRPAYSALLADETGNLWMRETTLAGEPNRWTVFGSAGAMLGSLELPAEFRPLRIGGDFVLGVVTDDLGVERVRLYALEKEV